MRSDYSEEQVMFIDSVRRTLQALPATAVKPNGSENSIQPDIDSVSSALSAVGLFSMMLPEEDGGLGLGLVEGVAAAIETGRAAVPFPAIECIAGSTILGKVRPDSVADFLQGKLLITAPVHGELKVGPGNRPELAGDVAIPFPDKASLIVAPVFMNGDASHSVLIDYDRSQLHKTDSIDLCYPVAKLQISGQISDNEIVAERVDDILGILSAAELLGASEYCVEKTVDYLKERRQFGKVIGTFQALKHIVADCQVRLDAMRASVEYAAALYDRFCEGGNDAPSREDVDNHVHIAKAYCSDAAQTIARECIQLHGGIAFTWEYGLHIHFRRISRLAVSAGSAYQHFEALSGIAIERSASYGGLGAEPDL